MTPIGWNLSAFELFYSRYSTGDIPYRAALCVVAYRDVAFRSGGQVLGAVYWARVLYSCTTLPFLIFRIPLVSKVM